MLSLNFCQIRNPFFPALEVSITGFPNLEDMDILKFNSGEEGGQR